MIEINHRSHKTSKDLLDLSQKSLLVFMQRKDIGFVDLPYRLPLWSSSQELGKKWAGKYKKLVVIGIGGSSIGTQAMMEVFRKKNVFFIDNVDGEAFQNVFNEIGDLKEVAWVVISKSGGTIETLCALEFVIQKYEDAKVYLYDRITVITEQTENSLNSWARENQVPVLEIPKDVGGRYSVLSPVGILPASFAGLNVESMRQGAIKALKETALITQCMGQVLESFEREEWITLFWFYCSRMRWFGVWMQQLWAESLGKRYSKAGDEAERASTPIWAIGACDQHSILQQVMEGARDKFNIFFHVEEEETQILKYSHFKETSVLQNKKMSDLLLAEAVATAQALNQNQIATMTLKSKNLDESQIGFIFMFFQLLVAGLGEALNINAFDQPGVELGKRLAKEKLSENAP